MKKLKISLVLLLALLFSGCATIWPEADRNTCIWGTSLTGFGVGGAVGNIAGAGAGLASGALLGVLFCEEGSPPPAPAPEQAGYFWPYDQDRDGVLDRDDKCPLTPLGAVVDTDGCPRTLLTLRDVHFAFDSAQLTSEAKSRLDAAVAAINANPSDTVSIEGHTDSMGSDAYNSQLSQRRARAVVDYLVSKGVSASRLKAVGKGENHPVASNDTREGRAKNRRVEIIAKE